jgi:hypothetical protein
VLANKLIDSCSNKILNHITMFKKIIIFSTVLSFFLGGLLVHLYRNFESRIFESNVSSTSSVVYSSSAIQSTNSENSLANVPIYPFLVTTKGVFDQTMKKVISFDKEQNSKARFKFMVYRFTTKLQFNQNQK